MELPELITIHVCTLFVIIVSILISINLWSRYKESKSLGSLFIFIYMVNVSITYFFVFMFRFPTPEANPVNYTGIFIPFIWLLGTGLVPYFGTMFTFFFLKLKYTRVWISIVTALTAIFVILLCIYKVQYVEVRPDVWEWIATKTLASYAYVCFSMALIPAILFLFYTFKAKRKIDRAKGVFLFVGFLMLAPLIELCDYLGVFPPIGIRRVLIAIALILLYLGIVMPRWFTKTFLER